MFNRMLEAVAGDRLRVRNLDRTIQTLYPYTLQDSIGLMTGSPVDTGFDLRVALYVSVSCARAPILFIIQVFLVLWVLPCHNFQ